MTNHCQEWFWLCLAILGAFTLIFIMLLDYNLKLGARTAKLEKKNGKELEEIAKLKKEIAELKGGSHE